MVFREAKISDITQMQIVRNSVTENMLSDPALVPDKDYEEFINTRGNGWICEIDQAIAGFAFADLTKNNIWALFVIPGFEKKGIGSKLHQIMLDWYFSKTKEPVWLGTAPGTRAEIFYEKKGWEKVGFHGREVKFEMRFENWLVINKK